MNIETTSITSIIIAGFLALLTFVEITPIKLNPWSTIGRIIGQLVNAEVFEELKKIKETQQKSQKMLDEHIKIDDERNADVNRSKILQFNNELIQNISHTREEFIEVLFCIDKYNEQCREHPNYPNSRATHAIANINRVQDERLEKHDFINI